MWDQAYLKAPAPAEGDLFGFAVSLAGDGQTLAVSAPNQNMVTGAVYVYVLSSGVWMLQQPPIVSL